MRNLVRAIMTEEAAISRDNVPINIGSGNGVSSWVPGVDSSAEYESSTAQITHNTILMFKTELMGSAAALRETSGELKEVYNSPAPATPGIVSIAPLEIASGPATAYEVRNATTGVIQTLGVRASSRATSSNSTILLRWLCTNLYFRQHAAIKDRLLMLSSRSPNEFLYCVKDPLTEQTFSGDLELTAESVKKAMFHALTQFTNQAPVSVGFFDRDLNHYPLIKAGRTYKWIVPVMDSQGDVTPTESQRIFSVSNNYIGSDGGGRHSSHRMRYEEVHGRRFFDDNLEINNTSEDDADYFGVELECVPTHPMLTPAISAHCHDRDVYQDFFLAKRDGSLPASGLEIVSAPATLGAHRKMWGKFFDRGGRWLASDYFSQTGGHIHVSRARLTPMMIGKLCVLLQDRNNTNFLSPLFGRFPADYCPIENGGFLRGFERTANREYTGPRAALNLSNSNTIELRLFKGTTNRNAFFRNLDVAASLIQFARTVSMKHVNPAEYFQFVSHNRADFPYLQSFLNRLGHIPGDPVMNLSLPDFLE